MKVLFVNVPNLRRDESGNITAVGPNAGSRWPWTGMTPGCYAPLPFYMMFAASYLQAFGKEVHVLDFVAMQAWHPQQWLALIDQHPSDVVVLEISQPVKKDVLQLAQMIRGNVVLVGPHCASDAEGLSKERNISHVVVGEYELPLLKICRGEGAKIQKYDHVDNLNEANGKPWHPYRDLSLIQEYYEPTIDTPKVQLTVDSSRGCFAKCHYCQWPSVMNNRTYRARAVPVVMDEIKTAIRHVAMSNRPLGATWMTMKNNPYEKRDVKSILFDDDTWGVGGGRVQAMCVGLKEIGLPWSAMTRLDIHKPEQYDLMFDSGAVALRAGIESFQPHVVETTNGYRDAKKQYEMLKYVLGRFRGIEVHLTSMKNMPGQSEGDRAKDEAIFAEMKLLAETNGNRLHYQTSTCIPFPGTDLYNAMKHAGHGAVLDRADYNGTTEDPTLAQTVREFTIPLTVKGK